MIGLPEWRKSRVRGRRQPLSQGAINTVMHHERSVESGAQCRADPWRGDDRRTTGVFLEDILGLAIKRQRIEQGLRQAYKKNQLLMSDIWSSGRFVGQ